MVYYPLHVLMLAGIREVLIISTPQDLPNYKTLLGDGSQLGMKFTYAEQPNPGGLAEAFIIGADFIGNDSVCLILGDNIFHSAGLTGILQDACQITSGAHVFGFRVKDPWRYGVVEFDDSGIALSIEEKPDEPKSDYAVVGLYFYGPEVVERVKEVERSSRGELEITDLNTLYLADGNLRVTKLPRGLAWLDTGTHEAMQRASVYVDIVQDMTGLYIACIEEIAYHQGWIGDEQMDTAIERHGKSSYAEYLRGIEREAHHEL
jgi:glucose-1-phosphate thymidylyltransferase